MKDKGILIVVSGFSGSGKGTIMRELLKKYDNYALSVSYLFPLLTLFNILNLFSDFLNLCL